MRVFSSLEPSIGDEPDVPFLIYDYKNTLTDIIQDDWYNYDINAFEGATIGNPSDIDDDIMYLVFNISGSHSENFLIWEQENNDEAVSLPSAIRI